MNASKFLTCAAIALLTTTSCDKSTGDLIQEQIATMSEMAELGTVEYSISKIIKANDNQFYTIGDRKILFSCKASVKAGIDLKDFSAKDVNYDKANNAVTVTLPAPKVLSLNVPAQDIKLEYVKVGALRSNFTTEERNNLLKQGEEDIKNNIANLGILEDAQKNAKLFFESMFSQMGIQTVNVEFQK